MCLKKYTICFGGSMNVLNESCHLRNTLLQINSETAKRLYYCVQWTGHFICKSDFYVKRERFESYLLLYTVAGSGELHYKEKSYKLTPHTVALIDCRLPHQYRPESDGWEFRYLHFSGKDTEALCELITERNSSPIISDMNETLRFLEMIYAAVENKSREELRSELIYRILMRMLASEKESYGEETEWLQTAYDMVAEGYGKGLTVSELARSVGISRSHFSIEFKRHTGFTPREYIENYRITVAGKLLCTTQKTVEEISEKCGFSSSSCFIRAFRRSEGVTPSEYRKNGGTGSIKRDFCKKIIKQ